MCHKSTSFSSCAYKLKCTSDAVPSTFGAGAEPLLKILVNSSGGYPPVLYIHPSGTVRSLCTALRKKFHHGGGDSYVVSSGRRLDPEDDTPLVEMGLCDCSTVSVRDRLRAGVPTKRRVKHARTVGPMSPYVERLLHGTQASPGFTRSLVSTKFYISRFSCFLGNP